MGAPKKKKGNGGKTPKPSKAGNVIFRRFRKLSNGRILDAHEYGYVAWPIVLKR